jgi:hypothetical protein
MSENSRSAQQDFARKVLAGINNNLPAQTSVTLAGTQYTRDTLAASVQQDIDIADAATNAKKAFFNAAATAREQRQDRKTFYKGLQSYVENLLTDPNVIAQFGFTSCSPVTPSIEAVTVAALLLCSKCGYRHDGKGQRRDGRDELRLAKTAPEEEGVSLSAYVTLAVRGRLEERRRQKAGREVLQTFAPDELPTAEERREVIELWTRPWMAAPPSRRTVRPRKASPP